MVSKLVINSSFFKNSIKFFLDSRIGPIPKHMAHTAFKSHTEDMVFCHILKISSWVLVFSHNQMFRIIVIELACLLVVRKLVPYSFTTTLIFVSCVDAITMSFNFIFPPSLSHSHSSNLSGSRLSILSNTRSIIG